MAIANAERVLASNTVSDHRGAHFGEPVLKCDRHEVGVAGRSGSGSSPEYSIQIC